MRRILAALVFLLVSGLPASAATVRYRTDGDLIAISDRVVRGRVLDAVVERGADGLVRTRTRVAVLENLAGAGEPIVTVSELGGVLPDGRTLWIPGTPRFTRGDEVVLCLERAGPGYRTVALSFAAFRVATQASGVRVLSRFEGEIALVGAPATRAPARTLSEFRSAAAAVTGQVSRPVLGEADAAALVAAARVDAPFTLLGGGFRWREADQGTPIVWYRNTLTPSPVDNGDTDNEIRVALQAWTAPPEASIALAFGGTRFDDVVAHAPALRYCSDVNLGAGLITFGDPRDELGAGTLAIGGGCGSGTTHPTNGTSFQSFTHGLVIFNDAESLSGFTSPPNITRILQHEVGHAIGLGHTDQGTANIMYASCCAPDMPVPPALGPDDRAGVVFIYPVPDVPACTYTLGVRERTTDARGGGGSTTLTTSLPGCQWRAVPTAPWLYPLGPRVRTGSGTLHFLVAPNVATAAARSAALTIESVGGGAVQPPMAVAVTQGGDADANGDGLFDAWQFVFGLTGNPIPPEHGPTGDPDGDGVSNLAEQSAGTHPRGTVRRYLAEGVSNVFFDTEMALFNPGPTLPATVLLRLQPEGGGERSWVVQLQPFERRTVDPAVFESLVTAPFATLIESDAPVVVDRTVRWDASGYGSHAETALDGPSTTWFLAEGSTAGDFQLFYLLQNANATAVTGTVRFLRPAPHPPIDHPFSIGPHARFTIPVDSVRPELANTDVSAIITASQPIIAERAMYLSRPGQPFAAGHGSAGVTAPATEWFLAEGATGSFFELFLLIANPSTQAASVRVDYLLPSGSVLTKVYAVGGESRFTVWVDEEQLPAGSGQKPLASTAVAMRVTSVNGVPIVVERSMWWPQPAWYEAHNAAGTTVTGTRWAIAAGETGGPAATETYILIANTSASPGTARVTAYPEDVFAVPVTHEIALPPNSRTNVAISAAFPGIVGERFGALIESVGASPVPIVVERATYESVGGVTWSAGTAAVATRLTP